MKKFAFFLLLFLTISSIHSVSFYYGVSGLGEADWASDAESRKFSYGAVTIDAGISFFDDNYLSLGAEVSLSPFFEGVGIYLSSEPFSTASHPFSFISANKLLYTPRLMLGFEYIDDASWYFKSAIALLNFRDKHFAYEFFTPVFLFSIPKMEFAYGLYLMRVTYKF